MGVLNSTVSPKKKKEIDIKFYFVILFVLSAFLVSTDNTLKFASVSFSSIMAFVMLLVFILDSVALHRFCLRSHPLQKWLWLLFLWVTISLLIARIDACKMIPKEVYSYVWTTGLNSADWRGLAFLVRFFLSIFAIDFIVSNINTKNKFFIIVNTSIVFYSLICLFGLIQIILFGLFNVEYGEIYIPPKMAGFFRIGGYVGEPQTFALLLLSCYFVVLASIKYRCKGICFSQRFLKALFFIASIDLIFTVSLAAFVGIFLAMIFRVSKYFTKRELFIGLFVLTIIIAVFYESLNALLFSKFTHELSTINERTITWVLGWKMFINNFLTGVGIGQAPLVNSLYIPLSFLSEFKSILLFDVLRQSPMNSYIELAAETGVIGLIILITIFYETYRIKFKENNNFSGFIKFGYGTTLLVLAVVANSSGGNFYAGFFILAISMYITGSILSNKIFHSKEEFRDV